MYADACLTDTLIQAPAADRTPLAASQLRGELVFIQLVHARRADRDELAAAAAGLGYRVRHDGNALIVEAVPPAAALELDRRFADRFVSRANLRIEPGHSIAWS